MYFFPQKQKGVHILTTKPHISIICGR